MQNTQNKISLCPPQQLQAIKDTCSIAGANMLQELYDLVVTTNTQSRAKAAEISELKQSLEVTNTLLSDRDAEITMVRELALRSNRTIHKQFLELDALKKSKERLEEEINFWLNFLDVTHTSFDHNSALLSKTRQDLTKLLDAQAELATKNNILKALLVMIVCLLLGYIKLLA